FQALAQLLLGLSHMLAQDVAAGGLVLPEVAHGTICRAALSPRCNRGQRRRTGATRASGRLARDEGAHSECDDDPNCEDTNCGKPCHPTPDYWQRAQPSM